MPCQPPIHAETFKAIQNVDVNKLSDLTEFQIRPILPCLVRMSLCAPLDSSEKWTVERKTILKCLSGIDVVNSLVGLLSIDFHALEQDARKEQQLRAKIGTNQSDSILISQLSQGVALEFERSDAARKLRLLLSELLFVVSQIKEPRNDFYEKSSELFENEVYLEEVSDVLCIAQAELPSLLPITEVVEALLHVPNGIWLASRLVANVPDTFEEVCQFLVANGEKQDEESLGGQKRSQALQSLCNMNPGYALTIRALCVEHCRMPGLAVALTLHHAQQIQSEDAQTVGISDVVSFVSGLLLGSDVNNRTWFAQFIRHGQKMDSQRSLLQSLREELLIELQEVLPVSTNQISESQSVQGCAFIRLFCALKGIAALRFNEEEVHCLLRLVTCFPPATAAGVRFASLGLCMLLACPLLMSTTELERQAVEWIKWLSKEVTDFEKASGVNGSFGEMLLLIAIHFHSNQTHAIADLVCTTLGMKSAVKANSLTRMKMIFTQDIFTEQVVALHAVKVPVTQNLNANMSGYLPLHCIYQLLKSRAFSKHRVAIKDWIYRQICVSSTPLHPLLPPLIEAYIQSVIMPSMKTDRSNEPITEKEIMSVFSHSVFSPHDAMDTEEGCSLTSQLLMLYYVLLYQDSVLSSMKSIISAGRKVHEYHPQILTNIPVKYLLHQAQKNQQKYLGLFAPLLRMLSSHYPQLCMVEDWLDEELSSPIPATSRGTGTKLFKCTPDNLAAALSRISESPSAALLLLDQLLSLPAHDMLPFAEPLTASLRDLVHPSVPHKLVETVKLVWLRLNTITPRNLRVMTVNALRLGQDSTFKITPYTEDDITIDPLIVLRCDDNVFRCPPILEIVVRVLEAYLQASKCYLAKHMQTVPTDNKSEKTVSLQERDELRIALVAAQESAAVQLLLEACLPNKEEAAQPQMLSNLREVQGLICSHLHQKFIADPNLAKLVHFQGYPSELLPTTVAGIPSMHICLDFIPELLSQPQIDKQIFAVELVSYLSLQYALPKSLGVARLAINVMNTLMGVLTSEKQVEFYLHTLPSLVRMCKAFPPLCEDTVNLLMHLGRICRANLATSSVTMINSTGLPIESEDPTKDMPREGEVQRKGVREKPRHAELLTLIHKTFTNIIQAAELIKPLKFAAEL